MKFVIPISPTAQMRDRIGKIRLPGGDYRGASFKDPKQRSREETIKAFLARHQPAEPMQGPLLLGIRAYLPFPQSKPKWFDGTAKEFREYAGLEILRPPVKPDDDNLRKQVMDCLTACEFWHDDAQVVGNLPHSGKFYSARPRWEIEIAPYNWRAAARAHGVTIRAGIDSASLLSMLPGPR